MYDFGPQGLQIINNIVEEWRSQFVIEEGLMEIQTSTIGIKNLFEASGHL